MGSDVALQNLHDRAMRGEPLSAEEQARTGGTVEDVFKSVPLACQ